VGGISTLKDLGVQGCELALAAPTTPTGQAQGIFIFRFGVLLAADSVAHDAAPALPIAPTSVVRVFAG
jgi:hypothetical protein